MEDLRLSMLVGVLALSCICLVMLYYKKKFKNHYKSKMSKSDIGILKVCMINLNALYERYRPDKNVIYLEDWEWDLKRKLKELQKTKPKY